jgi:hypothetical protein
MATDRNNENNVVGYRSGFNDRSLIILFFQKAEKYFRRLPLLRTRMTVEMHRTLLVTHVS